MKMNCRIIAVCVIIYLLEATMATEKQVQKKTRSRRNLWQFGSMIKCVTGRDRLDYNDYGCWCGKGGSGQTVDGVDMCCRVHDHCYDDLISKGTCTNGLLKNVYATTYDYTCSCASVSCADNWGTCDRGLCECDKAAAFCFKGNIYNLCNKGIKENDTRC